MNMGACNGSQFTERVDRTKRELWYGEEKITFNASKHPAFRGIVRAFSHLYDMQADPELSDEMTYKSPTTGQPVGTSFLQPRTREDLLKRRSMMKRWADYSGGTLGRTPDYLDSAIMAMASASSFFGTGSIDFAKNVRDFYENVREKDLLLTHTLINPQTNRAVGPSKQADPYTAARIVEKNSEGVVVRGARMLATCPLADEIMVFPSTVIRSGQDDLPYSMAFAIPLSTPGLKLICRESFAEDSRLDHPLASRFDEQDAVVVFDDVLVPWNRIFLLEDFDRANTVNEATDAIVFMSHQASVREIAKAEFFVGLTSLLSETIGADQFQHVQEKVTEVILISETMKAFVNSSEANAKMGRWGLLVPDYAPLNAARNLWPRVSPSMSTIVQQLGASGLMAIPPEGIFGSEAKGMVDKYFQSKTLGAEDRIKLFRLAWDLVGSSFGGRQELYERFFFGDPVRMAGAFYNWYDKEPYKQRVRELLGRRAE
jgi:4-hydroxyphenylacetate 3-monooxygenase